MMIVLDDALRQFFSRFVWAGRPLSAVLASPERARAEMRMQLANRPDISEKELENVAVPYPWCSVYREPPLPAPERFSPVVIRNLNMDVAAGTAQYVHMPKEINCPVQADFLFSDIHQRGSIEAQLLLAFQSEVVLLPIDWTDPRWYQPPYYVSVHARIGGKTKCKLRYESFVDNSDLETENARREIRLTFTGFLEAALPHPPVEAKIARVFETIVETIVFAPSTTIDVADMMTTNIINTNDVINDLEKQVLSLSIKIVITKDTEGTTAPNVIRFSAQVVDGSNNSLAQKIFLKLWVGLVDKGAPDGAQVCTINTGLGIITLIDNKYVETITNNLGVVEVAVEVIGAGTRWLIVELNGNLYTLDGTWI